MWSGNKCIWYQLIILKWYLQVGEAVYFYPGSCFPFLLPAIDIFIIPVFNYNPHIFGFSFYW